MIENQKSENIKVFIRLKPLQPSEQRSNITVLGDTFLQVCKISDSKNTKIFQYKKIFDPNTTQLDIYENVASNLVDKVLKGYNGTIFAYGQSGTGKTYTILGDYKHANLKGLIPNVFSNIFKQVSLADASSSYLVTVTFMEIYNENIRDLLNNSNKKLEIRERPDLGVYVKNLSGINVESTKQVIEIINKGFRNRAFGVTNLNEQSSRSHAIFTIYLEAKHKDGSTTFGKLNLVDLAGSERISKSLATGERLKEAAKINLSLSTLGKVISALIEKSSHIPYRNSKLTRLLQDSLGGNSLTVMIATISICQNNIEETVSTLIYADMAQKVKNGIRKNEANKSVLKGFEDKIKILQEKLEKLNNNSNNNLKKKNSQVDIKLEEIENEKRILQNQLFGLRKKILVGGENLLVKAQIQEELLRHSSTEIKLLDTSQKILENTLKTKKEESSTFERHSMSLQEQDTLLDIQIKEVEMKIAKTEKYLYQNEDVFQKKISKLLNKNKLLAKELGLANYIVNNSISKKYLDKVKDNIVWDEDFQDCKLNNVAHCGNNLKKINLAVHDEFEVRFSLKNQYKIYSNQD